MICSVTTVAIICQLKPERTPHLAMCLSHSLSETLCCAISSSHPPCLSGHILSSAGLQLHVAYMCMTHQLIFISRHFEVSIVCRALNGTEMQGLPQTVSPGSHGPTPPKPPSGSPMHAYTNPAFCPAFVSRIPKPAPLLPLRKPGDPKQISAHFKRNPRSLRLPLEQPQHNPQDPKQPAGTPQPATRDSLHPLEELPSTSQMQPAVPAMPAGFEMSLKPHRLGALQHTGQEDSDRPQQAAAEHLADDQQCPTSSFNLFHQPGHEVVSIVSEDAVQSSHRQEEVVGILPAGGFAEDGLHALHAGPDIFKHVRAAQQEGEVDEWDESSFGDMCRRLVAVTEVLQTCRCCIFGICTLPLFSSWFLFFSFVQLCLLCCCWPFTGAFDTLHVRLVCCELNFCTLPSFSSLFLVAAHAEPILLPLLSVLCAAQSYMS